jgi:hypothetical protein
VEAIQTGQHAPRIHVAGRLKWLADEFDQLVVSFHHVAVAVDVFVRHRFLRRGRLNRSA